MEQNEQKDGMFVPQPPAQYAKKYPYVIIVRGKVIYQGNDEIEAACELLRYAKSEEYAHDVIKYDAYGSKLTVYPLRADINPNALA